MSAYLIALGHNVALLDMDAIDPQPRNGEVIATIRSYSDGGARDTVLHCAPTWDVLETPEQYQALLEQFGLLDATTALVTFYTRTETFAWNRYNGTAIQPELGKDGGWANFFPRNFTIYIRDLAEVT